MTARFVDDTRKAYSRYEFHAVYHATVDFCSKTLSAGYFDVLKDRLYTRGLNDPLRRGSQMVLWKVTDALSRVLAPILSFTADEAYRMLPGKAKESVFLAGLPTSESLRAGIVSGEAERLVAKYEEFDATVRTPVKKAMERLKEEQQPLFKELKELETRAKAAPLSPEDEKRRQDIAAKTVGNSLDAEVTLVAPAELAAKLRAMAEELPELLIVSQVAVVDTENGGGLIAQISPAHGERCARCWCYTKARGHNSKHPELCPKCTDAVLTDFPNFPDLAA